MVKALVNHFKTKYAGDELSLRNFTRLGAACDWWERNHLAVNPAVSTTDGRMVMKIDKAAARFLYAAFVLHSEWGNIPPLHLMLDLHERLQAEDTREE